MQALRVSLSALLLGILFSFAAPVLLPRLESWYSTYLSWMPAWRHSKTMTRTPVYFISHGGPNLFEDYKHPAYSKLQSIGREITTKVKPEAVVVISAHWQGERDAIEVNTALSQGLIYDYYGFPPHYYEVKYPNEGSPDLAAEILLKLNEAGIKGEGVRRGLDHGVFSPFLVAFDPERNPLNVPVVQVSLFDTEDATQHYALGKALSSLREEGVLIICSGMAVHNLRDVRLASPKAPPLAYASTFDEALKRAVEKPADEREEAMTTLMKFPVARKAHPSFEHLLPIYVAAGAAGEDLGKRLWTLPEGSMSWAQYRFGEVDMPSCSSASERSTWPVEAREPSKPSMLTEKDRQHPRQIDPAIPEGW